MTVTPNQPLRAFLDELCERSAAAIVSQTALRHEAAIRHLRAALSARPGERDSLLADPVLEAAFGYERSPEKMSDLSALLGAELLDALDRSEWLEPDRERYRFGKDWRPYVHQEASWRALLDERPRSVLVSSGTGSGKTECFLVPMLRDLTRLTEPGERLAGVRALMLYPLNALIASQRDRLFDWTQPFGERARFCLYNGATPEDVRPAERRAKPNEVLDRATLRADPPPILVTNVTMLEYLLIRQVDAPILQRSRGKLRWVVLDEAHSYVGSQAAEIALLMRRVLRGFGVRPNEVRFVATSATLASGAASAAEREAVEAQLRRFLADLSGMDEDGVSVVTGHRHVPPLPDRAAGAGGEFERLVEDAPARKLREALAGTPSRTLGDLAGKLYGANGPQNRAEVLDLAECGAAAKNAAGERFLPLRLHLVHRAQPGFWACPNAACAGRADTPLADEAWPWGYLSVAERERCPHCKTPLYELAACDDCGAPHLLAEELADGRLLPPRLLRAEDEFTQGVDDAGADEEDGDDPVLAPQRRWIVPPPRGEAREDGPRVGALDPGSKRLLDRPSAASVKLFLTDLGPCAGCGVDLSRKGLSRARFGAPFLLGNVVPALLERVSRHEDADKGDALPADGRRLITFTDSRQGTARFSARLQQDSERNLVRSFLYHLVQEGEASGEAKGKIEELKNIIAQLEPLKDNPAIAAMLADKRDELAELEGAAPAIPWAEAERRLADDPRLLVLREEGWAHRDEIFERDGHGLARILMLRELYRRPRRANSAETMGLLRLCYPAIDKLADNALPESFRRRKLTGQDWRDFLYALVDGALRGNSAVEIAAGDRRWLGVRVHPKTIRAPGEARQARGGFVNWPSARSPHAPRSAVVKLLRRGLKLDLGSQADLDEVEVCLSAAFEALRPMLKEADGGFRLDLREQAAIGRLDQAWLCPRADRLVSALFKGLTPLQPQGRTTEERPCRRVTMPRHPRPFPHAADSLEAVDEWLREDGRVKDLRGLNLWTDLHDRIARFAPLLLSAEHSAQQPGWRLRHYEGKFRQGKLNVLNCSTTMEMGVDIGGLEAVVNANVPPSPANYRQRVGRAGRRDQAIAIALTFAKAEPFGWTTYLDPTRPLTAALRPPKVAMDSEVIAQRHVNALLLTEFLRGRGEQLHRLDAGAFFGREFIGHGRKDPFVRSPAFPAGEFFDGCEAGSVGAGVDEALRGLARGTALAGEAPEELRRRAGRAMKGAFEPWRQEWDALDEQLKDAQESAAKVFLSKQMERMSRAFLLGELASRGFLPGHGFPTDVVTIAIDDPRDTRRGSGDGENRFRLRDAPSRSLDLAIRDYAPGTEVVLDGLVHRSAGVMPNWKRADLGAGEELPQAIAFAWRCDACGSAGVQHRDPEGNCPKCGASGLIKSKHLKPVGFAVRPEPAHTCIDRVEYVAPLPPFVSLAGGWSELAGERAGATRADPEAFVFHRSGGASGHGYALCLACGRAEPEVAEAGQPGSDRPPGDMATHRPLRRRRGEERCPGTAAGSRAVQRHLNLGHAARTCAFELRLDALRGEDQKGAALALAVALREALTRALGVESGEVGYGAVDRGAAGWSVQLFDNAPGGGGFATRAPELIDDLLGEAAAVLDCPEGCGTACPACVLTYDSRRDADDLDRRAALAVLRGA